MHILSVLWVTIAMQIAIALAAANESAQTQKLGVLELSRERVHQSAEQLYRTKMASLAAAQSLDTDVEFLTKATRVLARLKGQAEVAYPESRDWQWELHTSADPDETAYAMAGGKLLLSLEQIRQWNLSENELAMLLAHEMQHALLDHYRLEYQLALQMFPSYLVRPFADLERAIDEDAAVIAALAPLGKEQELEADQAGWRLARKAGFPTAGLLNFFKKLVKHAGYPNFESASHPAPAQRYARARQWAIAQDDSGAANGP